MSIKQLTKLPTEADLEARIEACIKAAFPWLAPSDLKHQLKFEFKFGHNVVTVNGTAASTSQARLDILVLCKNIPLAVMELKREDVPLTTDDEEQGLSYARMLHPRPPLVVVTNGKITKILETHSGEEWNDINPSEAAVQKLIANAGTIAAGDLARAVETLLGPQSAVWISAIRAVSDAVIADLTGSFEEFTQPFVEDFLIPRNITRNIINSLSSSKRIFIVEGPPLSGKSTVLREIVDITRDSNELVTLFVEADGGSGSGLLQIIADAMALTLGWNVTPDNTRSWLRSLSRQSSSKLVLAIDGISAKRDEVRRDIEELTSDAFGENLKIILAIDDAVTSKLLKNETGRKATRIGRRAITVSVGALADNEFRKAVGVLLDLRIGIINGGEHAPEYRIPWVLRALASDVTASPKYADETVMAGLRPLLGPQLLHQVRERFHNEQETRHLFQLLAEATLEDIGDRNRSVSTVLESMANYAVRSKTARKYFSNTELTTLSENGFVKLTINESNESIIVARLPELLASEIAFLLGRRLAEQVENDPHAAADWLVNQSSHLPFGDVIAAQAIFDCASESNDLSFAFIERLLAIPPRKEKIAAGTRAALFIPGSGKVELKFQEGGRVVAKIGPYEKILDAEDGEELDQEMYADMEGWLILSHIAGCPFIAQSSDGSQLGRIDPALLIEVGTCPIVLRRPPPDPEMSGVLVHDLKGHGSIVCHNSGIVEPITESILNFIRTTDMDITEWLEEALGRKSLALTARLDIAFRHLAEGGKKADWAKEMLENYIKPEFDKFPRLH